MSHESYLVSIFALVVAGGVAVVIAGMRHRAKALELVHRERLAMIERGMVPPPIAGPLGEPLMLHDRPAPHGRLLSIGVVTIAFGLALGMIIGFAGNTPNVAVGIGGAIVFIGLAFVVNGLLPTTRTAVSRRVAPSADFTPTDTNRPPNLPE
jgi:hypothetical protein